MTSPTSEINQPNVPLLTNEQPCSPLKKCLNSLRRACQEYGYLSLCALLPAFIVYLLYLAKGLYPFGDGCVLVLDLNGQYISFYEGLHDILHGDADLFYSFSRNLGGEFLGIYDYYVASPFALLLGLFPEHMILEGLLFLFMLKSALCGLFMGFYLHKHAAGKPNQTVILLFSLMYALCSYCIIQQHNSMWIDAVLFLPLLALGIESLIRYGKFRLYVFSLAITVWSNFYIGYMVVIFTALYCFYYYFAHNRNNENNPLGENYHFLKSVGRVTIWSALAIGMAALVILSARYSLAFGKSDFSDPSWEITQKIDIFAFFQKFLPSSYDTVRPEGRPIVYCGILTIMLIPAYFMSKKFSMREKVASAIFILFFIASFAISSLDLIWHGFQKPNWLNFRYSFMLCFLLIVLAYRAFERIEFLSRKALLGSTAFIALYVLILPNLGDAVILKGQKTAVIRPFAMIWLSLACLFIYFIVICLYGKLKSRGRETAAMALVFLVCTELFFSGMADMEEFDADVSYSKYSRYHNMIDTLRPISYKVQDYDKGFYRMEKTYERKTNDNFALGMNGVSLSTSTLNRKTIDYLWRMGYEAKSHNSHYNGGNIVNDSLLGIKYVITSDKDMTNYKHFGYDISKYYGEPLFTEEDFDYPDDFTFPLGTYQVYENPYALSLIYGVADAWETFDSTEYYSPFDYMNAMITAMLGEEETVQVFVPAIQNGEPELQNVTRSINTVNEWIYKAGSESGQAAVLTYQFTVPSDVDLYFYYPLALSTARREVKVAGNGKSATFSGQNIISLGTSSETDLEVKVTISNDKKNLYVKKTENPICLYYFDYDTFADAMERLSATALTIDEGYTDSHLFGSVTTTSESQLMFTSIPYDEGWNIYVDGKRVDIIESADALISFRIEGAGEHRVELRYMPKTVALGLTVSIVSAFIFLLLLCLYPFLKRLPVFRNVILIQGEELPPVLTPEYTAAIEPGDIGAEDDEVSPPPKPSKEPSSTETSPVSNTAKGSTKPKSQTKTKSVKAKAKSAKSKAKNTKKKK